MAKKKLNLDTVLTQIVEALHKHSPRSLNFSKISRITGIPRSTLYYYFGKSKDKLLEESVRFGMKSYAQLFDLQSRGKNDADWDNLQRRRFRNGLRLARKYGWGPSLYFRYRNDESALGKTIREIEEKYYEGISTTWKRIHGSTPDERAFRLASYMKLGILWGIASDRDFWFKANKRATIARVIDEITPVLNQVMKIKF